MSEIMQKYEARVAAVKAAFDGATAEVAQTTPHEDHVFLMQRMLYDCAAGVKLRADKLKGIETAHALALTFRAGRIFERNAK